MKLLNGLAGILNYLPFKSLRSKEGPIISTNESKLDTSSDSSSSSITTEKIKELIEDLHNPYEPTPSDAQRELIQIGKEAVPALVETMKDNDINVSYRAALSLRTIGREAVPALVANLKNDAPDIIAKTVLILGEMGFEAKDAIPALDNLKTQSEYVWIREAAAIALQKIEKS